MNTIKPIEQIKKRIMRNDFTRTFVLIGIIASVCLMIYNLGKYVGEMLAGL